MEYGGWKLARAADRPSPLPRDANDPTNFPIVPYRREDLIPRWRLINDRPRSQWLELPPRNQSNATSIFRAVGASSIPKRGTENDWPIYRKSVNGELIGFTILVSSRNNYRAPLPWLAIYSIYPTSSLQNARDWSIFLFHGGEDLFVRSRRRLSLNEFYLFIIRIASLSMDFEPETYEYRENSSINISRACVSNSSRNNKFWFYVSSVRLPACPQTRLYGTETIEQLGDTKGYNLRRTTGTSWRRFFERAQARMTL